MNVEQTLSRGDTELKLILAGLGGQGIVFATRLLAQTAVAMGLSVMASEVHGMSQRGGSIVSHLRIGGCEAPLIRRGTADLLLAMEPNEAVRNLVFLRPGGIAFMDAAGGLQPEVGNHLERLGIRVLSLEASRMAVDLGSAKVANVALIGFAAAHPSVPLPVDVLRQTVTRLARRANDLNLRALEAGYRAGRGSVRAHGRLPSEGGTKSNT